MKKLLAILAIVLFATAAYAQTDPMPAPGPHGPNAPYANEHFFSNFTEWGPRTMWYQNIYYWVDTKHGIAANPFFGFDDYGYESQNNGQLQYFMGLDENDEEILVPFMWNSGVTPAEMYRDPQVDPRQSQIDLAEFCDWMDYPEYVGCTSYFYLYVYRPLCVDCLCNNWMCLGIYSIPSYWDLPYNEENPFAGVQGKVGKYSCIWLVTGQPYWAVVISGEVIDTEPADGVDVTWEWFGQNQSFLDEFPGDNAFNFSTDFSTLVFLPEPDAEMGKCTAYYHVGVVARTVSVAENAACGIKTFEATVSGIYYF